MRPIWAIAKREVAAFFVSPIAYVVLFVWTLFGGVSFYILCQFFATQFSRSASENPITMFFGGSSLFYFPLLVFAPVMTMRLIAEERRSGTIEALLTAPVTETQVVLGKYLAAMIFWITVWIPTALYVVIAGRYGSLDAGVIASTYLGVLGIGLHYMAIGVLMSAVSRNQIVAAVLTFMVLGVLFVVGLAAFVFEGTELADVFGYVSVWNHMSTFAKGIVDTRYVVYDVSVALLSLFLAVRVLAGRRQAV